MRGPFGGRGGGGRRRSRVGELLLDRGDLRLHPDDVRVLVAVEPLQSGQLEPQAGKPHRGVWAVDPSRRLDPGERRPPLDDAQLAVVVQRQLCVQPLQRRLVHGHLLG